MFGLLVFFTPTEEYSNGLFNEAAYSKFALLCGILAALAILVSTYGTQSTIPSLPKPKQMNPSKGLAATWKASKKHSIQIIHQPGSLHNDCVYRSWNSMVFTTYFTTYFLKLVKRTGLVYRFRVRLVGFVHLYWPL